MQGKISISRYSSNQPPYNGISIEIDDVLSGARVITVDISPEQFGNAISGLGFTDCQFDLGNVKLVGFKREHKTESIPLAKGEFMIKDENRQKELLMPYEVDGWLGSKKDFENHHNHNRKTNSVNVRFIRYIEAQE